MVSAGQVTGIEPITEGNPLRKGAPYGMLRFRSAALLFKFGFIIFYLGKNGVEAEKNKNRESRAQ